MNDSFFLHFWGVFTKDFCHIVIGISTSGDSPNVVNAIQVAKENQAVTIGFTGFDGGELSKLVHYEIHVESSCIEQVEDLHLMLEHLIVTALRQRVSEL